MTGAAGGEAGRGRRSALIVASDVYLDPGLSELRAPTADAEALAAVLGDPAIGGFEVRTLLNEPAHVVNEAVEDFLTDRSPDDLLLLHFSCHGIKDQGGELYFAMTNTKLRLLGATAVAADFVNRRMTQSRSQRIVLFLDCCYAGAFDRGMRARAGKAMDLEERFSGRGRAVITASGAVEYAFEGGALTESGDPAPSVFTTAMVRGLTTGEADRDQDGYVDLDELYDYVYDAVRDVTPHQTPGKWTFGVQGDLVIARRGGPVTEPSPLPADLQDSLASPLAGVRAGTVGELARLAEGRHQGLALAAQRALTDLTDDDSRTVAAAATAALAGVPAPPPPEPTPSRPVREPVVEPGPEPGPEPGREPATPTRSEKPRLPRRPRTRVLLAGITALLLVLAGVVVWRLVSGPTTSTTTTTTTIPASFDGRWVGTGVDGDGSTVEFTATLAEGLSQGQLASGNSSCYGGTLTVKEATDEELTTRFAPGGTDGCVPWTVVFRPNSRVDGELVMSIDPDPSPVYRSEFEIPLTRTG
jgi:hypothetical protein